MIFAAQRPRMVLAPPLPIVVRRVSPVFLQRKMTSVLTAIVAHVDAAAPLDRALAALDRACNGMHADIVVVQNPGVPADPPACHTPLTTIRREAAGLTPQLWAEGLAVARGTHVAFTLANCEVSSEWARAVIDALGSGAAGVAGPIERAPGLGPVDRAIYYLRYSAFLPSRVGDGAVAGEIPGDNAAYRRDVLDRHRDAISDGFWEVLFHRHLRGDGGQLWTRRAAVARFTGGVSLRQALQHRFAHGRHFGAWRVKAALRRPWQILAAAPLVPWVLMGRAAARSLPFSEHRWSFITSAPVLFLAACAWAAGEAVGAVTGAALPGTGETP